MSGQCVPFISGSPMAITVPGTELLFTNVCVMQPGEQPLLWALRAPCTQLCPWHCDGSSMHQPPPPAQSYLRARTTTATANSVVLPKKLVHYYLI